MKYTRTGKKMAENGDLKATYGWRSYIIYDFFYKCFKWSMRNMFGKNPVCTKLHLLKLHKGYVLHILCIMQLQGRTLNCAAETPGWCSGASSLLHPLHYPTLSYSIHATLQMLHYAAQCYTILHYTALCCTMLHYAALCCTMMHYAALRCTCLLYTSPSPRDLSTSRMPSSA